MNAIGILIMAAGRGERFRQAGGAGHKLNARFPDAEGIPRSVFEHTLRQALATGLFVGVVTRTDNHEVRRMCERYATAVTLLDSDGLGDSIAAGVKAHPDLEGWLIHLADMPFVTADIFTRIAEELTRHEIVRPCYHEHPGHPVGFSAEMREALCALKGDNGARPLLASVKVHCLQLNNDATVMDIDLPVQVPSASMAPLTAPPVCAP